MADIDGKLYCAVDGANELTQSCTLERIDGPEGHVLVLHHPGGGFRRFRIVSDGRGVIPADRAEQAQLALAGDNMIDVKVANDRYRFTATLLPTADYTDVRRSHPYRRANAACREASDQTSVVLGKCW